MTFWMILSDNKIDREVIDEKQRKVRFSLKLKRQKISLLTTSQNENRRLLLAHNKVSYLYSTILNPSRRLFDLKGRNPMGQPFPTISIIMRLYRQIDLVWKNQTSTDVNYHYWEVEGIGAPPFPAFPRRRSHVFTGYLDEWNRQIVEDDWVTAEVLDEEEGVIREVEGYITFMTVDEFIIVVENDNTRRSYKLDKLNRVQVKSHLPILDYLGITGYESRPYNGGPLIKKL